MAQAINHNNIIDVIKDTAKVVIDGAAWILNAVNDKKNVVLGDERISGRIETFIKNLKVLFEKDGLLDAMVNVMTRLKEIPHMSPKVWLMIVHDVQSIALLFTIITLTALSNTMILAATPIVLAVFWVVKTIAGFIVDIVTMFSSISLKDMRRAKRKINYTRRIIDSIIKLDFYIIDNAVKIIAGYIYAKPALDFLLLTSLHIVLLSKLLGVMKISEHLSAIVCIKLLKIIVKELRELMDDLGTMMGKMFGLAFFGDAWASKKILKRMKLTVIQLMELIEAFTQSPSATFKALVTLKLVRKIAVELGETITIMGRMLTLGFLINSFLAKYTLKRLRETANGLMLVLGEVVECPHISLATLFRLRLARYIIKSLMEVVKVAMRMNRNVLKKGSMNITYLHYFAYNLRGLMEYTADLPGISTNGSLMSRLFSRFSKEVEPSVIFNMLRNLQGVAEAVMYMNLSKSRLTINMVVLGAFTESLKDLMKRVLSMSKLTILIWATRRIIEYGIKLIIHIVRYAIIMLIRKVRIREEHFVVLILITAIIGMLMMIGYMLQTLSVMAILLTLGFPFIILFFGIILLTIKMVQFLARHIVAVGSLMALTGILVIFEELMGIAEMAVELAELCAVASASMFVVALMILALIPIAGALALLAISFKFILPLLSISILAIFMLATSMAAILFIAVVLIAIAHIKFTEEDKEKVDYKIKLIMSTVFHVLISVFENSYHWADKSDGDNSKNGFLAKIIKGVVGTFGAVFTSIAAVGILVPMVLSVLAILFIAALLWLVGKINFTTADQQNIVVAVSTVIGTCFLIINSILGGGKTGDSVPGADKNPIDKTLNQMQEDKSKMPDWLQSVLDWGPIRTLGTILDAILAVGLLAISIAAVGAVLVLAVALKLITKIDLNLDTVKTKVQAIIDGAMSVINAIFFPDKNVIPEGDNNKPEEKSWLSSAVDWVCGVVDGISKIAGMLATMGFVAMAVISVGLVWLLAHELKFIAGLELDRETVTNKVDLICNTAESIITTLIGKKSLNDFKDLDKVRKNLGGIEDTIEKIRDLGKIMGDFTHISDKDVENNTKVVGNYIKYLDKVNTIKVENVKTITRMFEKMAEFAKSVNGDFDKLADTLNEKIAPLLEELKNLMGGLPKHMDSSSKAISQTIVDYSPAANLTPESIQRGAFNTGNADNEKWIEEQKRKAVEAKEEQSRIVSILNDIMDIMNGQGAYADGVKTR